jgi:hypothetical protein
MISVAAVFVDIILPVPEPVLCKGAILPGHVQARVAQVVLNLERASSFVRQPEATGGPSSCG